MIDWAGDPKRLALAPSWRDQGSNACFLATREGRFEFSRALLKVWERKTGESVEGEDPRARAIREAYEEQLRRERQEPIIRPPSDR